MQVIQDRAGPHLNSMWSPIAHYPTPTAVLDDPNLATFQKRAILSSWASDLYAVESMPWLREVPGVPNRLPLADILAALRALDEDEPPPRGGAAMRTIRFVRTKSERGEHRRTGPPSDEDACAVRLAARRGNLERYRRILTTPLTDLERAFVKRRIAEERAEIDRLEHEIGKPLLAEPASAVNDCGRRHSAAR